MVKGSNYTENWKKIQISFLKRKRGKGHIEKYCMVIYVCNLNGVNIEVGRL